MIRLRTLAGMSLVALLAGGFAGCNNRKGDLGAERIESAPVIRTVKPVDDGGPARAEVAELDNADAEGAETAKAEPVELADPKEATAELVSLRPAALADVASAETKAKAPGAPAAETKEEAADEPKKDEGKEPPKPTPAPTEETPEQKAERLLKEAERLSGVTSQENVQAAEAAYQTGLKLFNDLEYEDAKKYFERAVALDPAHPQAQQKLRTVNALLGVHVERIAAKIKELEANERVRIQESVIALAQAIEEARRLEERGSATALETEADEKERVLTEQLDNLRKAQDRYRRVKEIINWMPPTFDLPTERATVDAALIRVRQKIAEKEDEISFLRRVESQRAADAERISATELFKARVQKLLEQVKELYDRQDYKAAEYLAIRVLQIDPLNGEAESWKSKARGAYHAHERDAIEEAKREEMKRSWEDMDEASISYAPLILYPSNWDQITRRSETASMDKKSVDDGWKSDIKKKLQRKVSFEFIDTPLEEAIGFLRSLAQVTMVLDPKVVQGAPAINLRVSDMSLDLALEWILKMAELDYVLQDQAIFISKTDKLTQAVEMKIYDVSDLVQTIPDFPGPDLQLTPIDPTGGGAGGGANPFQAAAAAPQTVSSIADMIKLRVRPDMWEAAQGTSIEEKFGKLLVIQRPEIHALIDQLLSNFRSSAKMMINIESRFLTIREAYLEDIGVEFQGLDPNVLFGDFGDITRLSRPTGFRQPRQTNNTDPVNGAPNAPFPGFTNGPDRVLSGQFSQVGSIVNHTLNFFRGDEDTISGLDSPQNPVLNGGFSGQVTILNNAQVQAFIKALAVRENTSVLLAPRLTVFNTQRAHVFVARQQSYVADYSISADNYDPEIRQFLQGIVLDVKPVVSSDRRYVTLELRPTITDLVSFPTIQINTYTLLTGTNGAILIPLALPIQFPNLRIRRLRTTVTVPDGGILLTGGLYRNIKFNSENGVPFLSDLPVVGRLFRWNRVDNAKSNLAILVSPRIIMFNEEEERL